MDARAKKIQAQACPERSRRGLEA